MAQAAPPEVVRRTTREVLSQADYQAHDGPSLLDRLVTGVLEQLGRFLLRFGDGGGTGSVVAAVALVGIVLLVAAAVVVFLRRLRPAAPLGPVEEGSVGRDPRSWADEATRHEADGDLRQALRCRYRETLARLAAAGLVEEVPGRTTGEYRATVAGSLPAVDEPFTALTIRFEQAWYGGRPVDAALLEEVKRSQHAVLNQIPGHKTSTRT